MQPEEDNTRLGVAVGEIRAGVAHLISGVADIKVDAKETRKELREEINLLSTRITAVEQFKWKAIGISTAIASIVPILFKLLNIGG